MRIHSRALILISLLIALSSALNVGALHADPRPPIRRELPGVSEVPQPELLRRHLPLVERGDQEISKSPRAERKRPELLRFDILSKPSFQGPSGSHESTSSHEHPGLQRPAKKPKLSSSTALANGQPELELNLGPPIRNARHARMQRLISAVFPGEKPARGPNNLDNIPLDPPRRNIPDESRKTTLYHFISPDPNNFEGLQDLRTGERSYYRKLSNSPDTERATYNKLAKFYYLHPVESLAMARSRGQKQRYWMVTPVKWEEYKTMSHVGHRSYPDWHKITPKSRDQLPPGTQPWTDEDLRRNLIQQHDHFEKHEAGQGDSVYAALDRKMREMCNTEHCDIKPGSVLLQNRFENPKLAGFVNGVYSFPASHG